MIKCKWIPALCLILLAAACGDKSSPTAPMADTPENRKIAAKRYLEAVPPQELLKNITGNMSQRLPEPARKQFLDAMADKDLLAHTYRISEEALIKHFTPEEMNAMGAFFGSPAGKSARAKFSPYMAEIMPQVNDEVKKAFTKMQKPEEGKEGAPKAEQPAAAAPKPEQAKPEEAKPAPPATPQAKPEQPKPEMPKAGQPKKK